MGKPTGFMEITRQTSLELPPEERIRNFNEFHVPLHTDEQQAQGARCMDCGVPFCQSGVQLGGMFSGCPLNNLIPEWNDLVYQGKWDLAVHRLIATNRYPEFTSRVCPALCEAACTCGNVTGDPVTVKENERAIVEYGYESGAIHAVPPPARTGKTVAVIGDSTFMHSGMTGLANIAYNQSNSTVIILDNSITGMTGHQQNPTTGFNIKGDPAGKIDLEALCRAMGFNRVRVVDPYDLKETDRAVKEELAANEPSVIISRRPCALLKYVKHKAPLKVNTDKCIGCKSCMKIGCPAISMKEGKAHVDFTQCVGCGVCQQLCPVDAFESTGKEG